MARYISRASAFKKTVRKATQTLINTPQGPEKITSEEPIVAIFRQAGTTPWEAEQALERFKFLGLGEGENPLHRVSSYDTDEVARSQGWSTELKKHVEDVLDAGQGPDYFRCDKPRLSAPWPTYDDFTDAKKIAERIRELGLNVEHACAYERENKNRENVVAALEALVEEEQVLEDVVVRA